MWRHGLGTKAAIYMTETTYDYTAYDYTAYDYMTYYYNSFDVIECLAR